MVSHRAWASAVLAFAGAAGIARAFRAEVSKAAFAGEPETPDGFVKDEKIPDGFTPAPCGLENSNREPGWECECLDSFYG